MPIVVTLNPSLKTQIGAKGARLSRRRHSTGLRFKKEKGTTKRSNLFCQLVGTFFGSALERPYGDKRERACGGFSSSHSSLTASSSAHALVTDCEIEISPYLTTYANLVLAQDRTGHSCRFIPSLDLFKCIQLGLARHLRHYSLQR